MNGKRGIGWHGCALIYYLYKVKTDNKHNIEYDVNGCEIHEARKNIVYIDQILESSNKHDGMMVISLLEAPLVAINDQLPFINKMILQSDNAIIEPTAKKARDYSSCANHVFYERSTNSAIGINFEDIIKEIFMIKLQSFSGVDI